MKRFILHTLEVKPNSKIQFQIKLPSNINGVESIKITHPFSSLQSTSNFPIASDNEVGWLWLRVPDSRDVFYSEVLRPESYNVYEGLVTAILSTRAQWHFNGTKHEFLAMDVPVTDTVIYGFYWDRRADFAKQSNDTYQVKIYLKLF